MRKHAMHPHTSVQLIADMMSLDAGRRLLPSESEDGHALPEAFRVIISEMEITANYQEGKW